MRKRLPFFLFLLIAASPAPAQDAVKVDPAHHKVVMENDQMRVLKVKYGAREKSVMHEHLPAVVIFLGEVNARATLPDGSTTDLTGKPNEVRFSEATKHSTENLSDKPLEMIMVEVKPRPALAPKQSALDPVKVDPEHHKVEFEDDRVRVLRINFGPRDKTREHEHPNGVAVFLTDVNTKFTMAGGKTRKGGGKRGEAIWAPPERHVAENLSDKPAELILIELRR